MNVRTKFVSGKQPSELEIFSLLAAIDYVLRLPRISNILSAIFYLTDCT